MSRFRLLPVVLVVGLIALLIPLAIALAQDGEGTVTVSDSNDSNLGAFLSDSAAIQLTGLPALSPDKAYEGWFVSDDGSRKESTGVFQVVDGAVRLTFVSTGDNAGENLLSVFDKFVVTIEPVPDDDLGPSDDVALIDQITEAARGDIRKLVFSNANNPAYSGGFHAGTPKGDAVGLRQQTKEALRHATLSAASTTVDDVQLHACHVINIVEGAQGENFTANCSNPGDGIGVLNYASQTIAAADAAAVAAPDDAAIVENRDRVVRWAQQTWDLSQVARDIALDTLATDDLLTGQLKIQNAQGILDQAFNSSKQTYWASQRMGTYVIAPAAAVVEGPGPVDSGPGVGDSSVPTIALWTLVGGVLLLVGGVFIYRRSRVLA